MVRLRDAVMAIALATGGVGCATFCDECDDFPSPGGPGGYSMMPGTYTGPPAEMSSTTGGPAAMPTDRTPSGPAGASGATSPASEGAPTPPPAPSATAPAQRGGATSQPTGPGGAASIMPAPGSGLAASGPDPMISPASATGAPAAFASSPDRLPPLP